MFPSSDRYAIDSVWNIQIPQERHPGAEPDWQVAVNALGTQFCLPVTQAKDQHLLFPARSPKAWKGDSFSQ